MASTVRISDNAKKKMKKLIKYLSFKTNQDLSQMEIIEILIDNANERKEDLIGYIHQEDKDNNYDWKKDPIFDEVNLEMDEDTSENVDNILYGDS